MGSFPGAGDKYNLYVPLMIKLPAEPAIIISTVNSGTSLSSLCGLTFLSAAICFLAILINHCNNI